MMGFSLGEAMEMSMAVSFILVGKRLKIRDKL
jgi:hypothetical protein